LGSTASSDWRAAGVDPVTPIASPGDGLGPFTVVATSQKGNGRVFAISDNSFEDSWLPYFPQNQALLLSGLSWVSSNVNTPPAAEPNLCDLEHNGTVSVADIQLIVNQALGVIPAVNDLNGDGVLNVVDIQIENRAALGFGCAAQG
jgi:hypothetical protein